MIEVDLVEGVNARYCTKCNELKSFNEFYKRKSGKYGYRSTCKICSINESKKYAEENEEKVKAYQAEFYKNNKKYYEEYAKNNKEKIKKYQQEYYQNNREERLAYFKGRNKRMEV